MAKTKKSAAAKYADQIGAESTLRFGPQENALRNRLGDIRGARQQAVRSADTTAAGAISSAKAADPQLTAIYADTAAQSRPLSEALAAGIAARPRCSGS